VKPEKLIFWHEREDAIELIQCMNCSELMHLWTLHVNSVKDKLNQVKLNEPNESLWNDIDKHEKDLLLLNEMILNDYENQRDNLKWTCQQLQEEVQSYEQDTELYLETVRSQDDEIGRLRRYITHQIQPINASKEPVPISSTSSITTTTVGVEESSAMDPVAQPSMTVSETASEPALPLKKPRMSSLSSFQELDDQYYQLCQHMNQQLQELLSKSKKEESQPQLQQQVEEAKNELTSLIDSLWKTWNELYSMTCSSFDKQNNMIETESMKNNPPALLELMSEKSTVDTPLTTKNGGLSTVRFNLDNVTSNEAKLEDKESEIETETDKENYYNNALLIDVNDTSPIKKVEEKDNKNEEEESDDDEEQKKNVISKLAYENYVRVFNECREMKQWIIDSKQYMRELNRDWNDGIQTLKERVRFYAYKHEELEQEENGFAMYKEDVLNSLQEWEQEISEKKK